MRYIFPARICRQRQVRTDRKPEFTMRSYFAPMEGITTHIYRRVHARLFGGADRYYAPFIAPDGSGNFRASSARDVLPENNTGIALVPQLLCNRAEPFLAVARQLADIGYSEVNLNLGCPSGTVVSKHKGSGAFADLSSLDDMLADIFSRAPVAVSVKTRMGLESVDEFGTILEIYNKYPITELTIHARARSGMYKSPVDREAFLTAAQNSCAPVCYNGNIFRPEDVNALQGIDRFMLGRGAVMNPALFRELRGGAALRRDELREFHDTLLDAYLTCGLDARAATSRMKELWFYMDGLFPHSGREMKVLNKSRSLEDYRAAASVIFTNCEFDGAARFNK